MNVSERFQPVDWYDDKRKTPKLYRDMDTGEEITLYEYRKRRRAALAVDEGDDDEQDDELETQAFAEPAPRPRLFSVPQAGDSEESRPTARRMGIAEMLAPACAGFATSVALIRLRDRPGQVFVPPREVTDPLLRPLGRIVDRHLPMDFALLIGEDGKDVAQFIIASGAAMTWFTDAMRQYEEGREYVRQQYAERNGNGPYSGPGGGNGAFAYPAANAAADSPGDVFQRVRGGNGSEPAHGVRANGTTDAPVVRDVGDAEAAARLRDLFSADYQGRLQRGLDAGR